MYQPPREETPNPLLQARLQVIKIGSEALLKYIDMRTGIRIIKVEFVAVCRVFVEEALEISIIVLEVILLVVKKAAYRLLKGVERELTSRRRANVSYMLT